MWGKFMSIRRVLRAFAPAILVVVLPVAGCARKPAPEEIAETILVNGGIYTVDAQRSWAEAAAVRDGR
jgi:hypothetical protein